MQCAALLLCLTTVLVSRAVSAEPCSLHQIAELPVTMTGMTPTVHAKINGIDAVFVADSGAFFSLITPSGAKQYNLALQPAPFGLVVVGIGGESRTYLTRVGSFGIFNIVVPNLEFLVAGNEIGDGVIGLLGQNVFRLGDVEYDLANGAIRLHRTHGDCKKASLVYWANAKNQIYSDIDIAFATATAPHTRGTVYVNGQPVHAMFDTGASVSVLSPEAARRAGVTRSSPGVKDGGDWIGMGQHVTHSWIAPFSSFKIGDEEVQHTQLRIGDTGEDVDMLVGADFFLSHRVLVATSQRRLYFTYNGGPVFNLTRSPAAAAQSPPAGTAEVEPPLDAAGYARRGAAATSRHDYAHAIADLTRACELAGTESAYFYQRGVAYSRAKESDKALADFDQAIKLKPDDVPALLARAALRDETDGPHEAIAADLEAADRAAAKTSDARREIATLYQSIGNSQAAITQLTLWIDSHNRDEVDMAEVLNERCWVRALSRRELEQALDDCDRAVRTRPEDASFRDSRGLIHLRLGHYDKAIAEYDKALRLNPKIVWSLYGRGIAKLRKGDGAGGQADLAAATALDPHIAETAARYDIKP